MVERVPGPGGSRETGSDQYRAETAGPGHRPGEPVAVDAEVNDPGRGSGHTGTPGTGHTGGREHTGTAGSGQTRPGGRGTAPNRVPEQPGAGADHADPAGGSRPHGAKLERVRERWNATQGKFVDDPQGAVREADALAAEVADAVVAEIEERRSALRSAWNEGEGTDTESLRVALRDYRSFVEHLVSTNA
ncbi:hypothetical protein CQJ94_21525 [Glycomyces fuscus]|nr:hypothetical protein CQJ94_21525 [Glycomyces fuscus]